MFKSCYFKTSGYIISNMSIYLAFEDFLKNETSIFLPELIDQKWDALICSFPGIQCLGWIKFAKLIIFRFAHRCDHHVWNPKYQRKKWIKILNMIISYYYNKNINTFVTNIYDYYYMKHSIYSDDINIPYLWPNFAHHFQNEFGINKSDPIDINAKTSSSFYIYYSSKKPKFENCSRDYKG